ncbi:Nn.00g017200.m01.CDS01 [Neocucurbitaria sp. VM-36]
MLARPTAILTSPYRASSCLVDKSAAFPAAHPSAPLVVLPDHCAPAADAAFERCSGQAMQILALPRPTSLLPTPFGRTAEPEDGLAKYRPKFSPNRPEQQSYPSPPMSEPHSPSRRLAQTVESGHLSYSPAVGASQRPDAGFPLPPPSSSLYDPRSALSVQSNPQQRPLYPGEPQHRGQSIHYQPGRTVEHGSYGSVPVPQNYGYGYPNAGVPPYSGPRHTGPIGQTAIAAAPSRPIKPARRTKAHVASACVNCKKAHLSCDIQRPCGRCVASGKQDTCKDVQHKKRGRPRLRDDREFLRPEEGRRPPSNQIFGSIPAPEALAHQTPFPASHPHLTSDAPRILESTGQELAISNTNPPTSQSPSRGQPSSTGSYGRVSASPYAAGPNLAYQTSPMAFLNLDLVIQKSNQAFQDLVSFLGDVRGKQLGDLLEVRQNESLQRLRNELRDERDEREPTYMAPITPVGQDPMRAVMDSVMDQDIDQVSHAFTDRPMFLSFRLPGGQFQSLHVQIRLAKTSLYFVTLVVRSPPRLTAPSLLTQQLAPPTPIRTSQTMSAPTTAPVAHFAPQPGRPASSTSSAPSSPYFNFSSVRTSLPAFSPSSYNSSPSYGYSPTACAESGYFPTIRPPSQPTAAYSSSYTPAPRNLSVTSEPLRDLSRPERLEGLHLPPIRTGPAPLGSPVHLESSGQNTMQREHDRVRRIDSPSSAEQRRPETPETGKRRRLNIHEVLE